jgi:uncharacterized protein
MVSATVSPAITIAAAERSLSVWRAYAESEDSPAGAMSALTLEGFLTALAICPKALPITIWYARLWGDVVPTFRDDAQQNTVLEAIIAVRDGIVARLALGREHYRPACLPLVGRPKLDDVRKWVAGFWKVLELHPDWWLRLYEDRKLRSATIPFMGFMPDEQGRCMEETDDNREQLYLHAGALGVAVLVLDRTKKKREASAAAAPVRNARCPCGSGRKYKHCCA